MRPEKKTVKIGISAKQTEGDGSFEAEPVVMNLISEAEYIEDENSVSIEYDEHISDDGAMTHTRVFFEKAQRDTVSVFRTGDVRTSVSFSDGGRCACSYNISGMSLDFVMVTKSLKNTVSPVGGSISIIYNMEMKGIIMSRNEYKLTVIAR